MLDFFINLFFKSSNDNQEPFYTDMNMLTVELCRAYHTNEVTMGMLDIKGIDHPPIFTLELPWLDNQKDISCIPDGQYICKPHSGKKYKEVYQVHDVPNRTGILFHAGNTTKDIEGCILLGVNAGTLNAQPAVLNSKVAIDLFKNIIGHEEFILEIMSV